MQDPLEIIKTIGFFERPVIQAINSWKRGGKRPAHSEFYNLYKKIKELVSQGPEDPRLKDYYDYVKQMAEMLDKDSEQAQLQSGGELNQEETSYDTMLTSVKQLFRAINNLKISIEYVRANPAPKKSKYFESYNRQVIRSLIRESFKLN